MKKLLKEIHSARTCQIIAETSTNLSILKDSIFWKFYINTLNVYINLNGKKFQITDGFFSNPFEINGLKERQFFGSIHYL